MTSVHASVFVALAFACGGTLGVICRQDKQPQILDVAGLRVLQNGEVRWQVMPTEDGAKMSFLVGGVERISLQSRADICAIVLKSATGTNEREMFVGNERVADVLEVKYKAGAKPDADPLADPVTAVRMSEIAKNKAGIWAVREFKYNNGVQIEELIEPDRASLRTDTRGNQLELGLTPAGLIVDSKGSGTIAFDVKMGGEQFGLTVEGNLVQGMSVSFRCGSRVYKWEATRR
jgi:hypothetical protein